MRPSAVVLAVLLPMSAAPTGCAPSPASAWLTTPASSFALPAELTEVSGMAAIDEHTVACVQDEAGVVFFVDVRRGEVVRRAAFGRDGDYEGLARVGDALWVLRSDGRLRELTLRGDELSVGRSAKFGLKDREFEGLGYDPVDSVLLVALKQRAKGSVRERAERLVYRFDVEQQQRLPEPALATTVERIVEQAAQLGSAVRADLKARFSSVAVHPRTGELWLLSAADHLLLAFARDGRLVAAHRLDARQLPQPEAMTFLADGALVIASEGDERGPARVQVFRAR